MKLNIDLNNDQIKDLKEEIENKIREDVTEDTVINMISNPNRSLSGILIDAGIENRYQDDDLMYKLVKDLSDEDMLVLFNRWIMKNIIGL